MSQLDRNVQTPKKEEGSILLKAKNQNKDPNETSATTNKRDTISFFCEKENDLTENSSDIISNLIIKSYCRFKPINENDTFFIANKDEESISINNSYSNSRYIKSKCKIYFRKIYKFYKIFAEDSTNKEVFKSVCKPLIYDLIFNKRSGLIFSYGNSNAGKTFTIFGSKENPGILADSIYEIFKHLNKKGNKSFQIYCNFIEIINEEIYDLFYDEMEEKDNIYNKKINIIENSNNYYLENVKYIKLDDINKINGTINRIIRIRNKARNCSSNLLFKIIILNDRDFSKIDLMSNEFISLTFADLGTKDKRKLDFLNTEYQSINNLEKCLKILKYNNIAKEKKLVPLKDSILTKILSEYFLSKKNIKLICNINPKKEVIEEAIRAINISCLIKDTKLNKSKNSKYSINSKILEMKDKSKLKNEKENVEDLNESQKNIPNISANAKNERKKDNNNNNILDEIDEFISKNTNKNNNNINSRNASPIIDNRTSKNDIIEEKIKNTKKGKYTKNKSQIINSNEIQKLMKKNIDILISEIKKLRAEVDILKCINKDNNVYNNMEYSGNIPQYIQKSKNKYYFPKFQNPFMINFDNRGIGNKFEQNYSMDKENDNNENNENVNILKKDNKSPFPYNPFGVLYYNPFNSICPFPYGPFYPNNSYYPFEKSKIFGQYNIKEQQSTEIEDNNNTNKQYINNKLPEIYYEHNSSLNNSKNYVIRENYYDSYYEKEGYVDNENSNESRKKKVKKTPKKKNTKNIKTKKYIEKSKEYKKKSDERETKYN